MTGRPYRVLITGASSGIGAALAERYANQKADLLLTGRDAMRLRAVALRCTEKGATVSYIVADVRDAITLHRWIVDQDRHAPIDLVIANAGISGGTFGSEAGEDARQVRAIFDTNVDGVLHTIHPVLPRMVARKNGQISIISSLAAFAPWPGAPAYAASKAAVKTYGLALRIALARHNVRVNVVCPGFIRTPMTDVNPYHMPFLMDAGLAADVIEGGLRKNPALLAFPWQMVMLARFIGILPFFLQNLLLAYAPGKPPL